MKILDLITHRVLSMSSLNAESIRTYTKRLEEREHNVLMHTMGTMNAEFMSMNVKQEKVYMVQT